MDRLVTLIGGSGFIGRSTVEHLARAGWRMRIVARNTARANRLKPLANLGQIQIMPGDLRASATLQRALDGADAVVNFAGILAPTGGASFADTHARGPATLADVARAAGVQHFVQVSAIGADPNSPGEYGRSKAAGEAAVLQRYPDAAILRPSVVFGPEDQFTNRFAKLIAQLPVVPVIAPRTRFQPVYVNNVADAISRVLTANLRGVYELAGPEILSMRQLNERIGEWVGVRKRFIDVPEQGAALLAKLEWLPFAPITADQLAMLSRDNVADPTLPGLEALGIAPVPMGAVAGDWLVQYRPGGRFAGRLAPMGPT
jgi:NADH dehydrogenase